MDLLKKWINLCPEQGNFTFGYYDRCPWDASGELHLALKIPQQERLPEIGEKAVLGFVQRGERKFHAVAETEAWGHQVGCHALWLPGQNKEIVFNSFSDHGTPVTTICDINGKMIREIQGHFYNVSPDGKWASSFDYSRIPLRGYSFARCQMRPDILMPDQEKDGLFLINMESGERKLLVSYGRLFAELQRPYDLPGMYIWMNQGIFNCDSSRLVFLLRYRDPSGKGRHWYTNVFTVNTDGSDLICCLNDTCWQGISHEIWGRTPREMLVDANWTGTGSQYVVFEDNVHPIKAQKISDGLGPAGHLCLSPDNKWIAADTYGYETGKQQLGLVNVETGEIQIIGEFRHKKNHPIQQRCDLHPRWSPDSTTITVDTMHEGQRKIYMWRMAG
jgi:hypothetical protein